MDNNSVRSHYNRPGLLARIDEILTAQQRHSMRLTPDYLAPLDQFHTGGKAATLALAKKGGITNHDHVLDVGGGLGGPARMLAAEIGCRITVLDLTEEYVNVGRELTRRCGLEQQVSFVHGDALSPPFDDSSFSVVWSQHSSMNVPDRRKLYSEIARVLKPGSRYLMHEVFAGPKKGIAYPVPWASDSASSHMIAASKARRLLTREGFSELNWSDTTEQATEWFRRRLASTRAEPGPQLGIHLLLGDVFKSAFQNLLSNLEEKRVSVVEAVWSKPPGE